MQRQRNFTLLSSITAILLIMSIPLFLSCQDEEDEAELGIAGPLLGEAGAFYFQGQINMDLVSNCGTVRPARNLDGGGSQPSDGGDSGTSTYEIESFFIFENGEEMLLRFNYNQNRERFSLNPAQTITQTCRTEDGIRCSAIGTRECETIDNIRCGGAQAFIFRSPERSGPVFSPEIQFQANSGTLNWRDGMVLTSDQNNVLSARWTFNMAAEDGTLLRGEISCNSDFDY